MAKTLEILLQKCYIPNQKLLLLQEHSPGVDTAVLNAVVEERVDFSFDHGHSLHLAVLVLNRLLKAHSVLGRVRNRAKE